MFITSFNSNTLENFTGMFRYSEALNVIDDQIHLFYLISQKLKCINLSH